MKGRGVAEELGGTSLTVDRGADWWAVLCWDVSPLLGEVRRVGWVLKVSSVPTFDKASVRLLRYW